MWMYFTSLNLDFKMVKVVNFLMYILLHTKKMFFKAITQGCLILTTSKWLYIYIPIVPYYKWFCKEHFHIHFPILFFLPLTCSMHLCTCFEYYQSSHNMVLLSLQVLHLQECPFALLWLAVPLGFRGAASTIQMKNRIRQRRKVLTHTSSSKTSYPIMLAGTRKRHQPICDPGNLACRS